MHEYEALPGGEELVDSFRREMEDEYLRSVGDGRFHRRAVLHEARVRSGWTHRPPGGRNSRDGNLFWPECVGTPSVELPQWSNPDHHDRERDGTDDDEQRIRYLTGRARRMSNVLPTASMFGAISSGSLLDNFEWTSAIGQVRQSSPSTARPSRGSPKPSARWYAGGDAESSPPPL